MIVKGIIKSIDVQGNTCVVRMPYFETAGNDEIIATATVSNSPGSYNGYKVDDVVWVAFENDQLECPVIIGKLYLGIEAERADPRGTLNVVDSKVSRTAEIPFDTKLGRNLEPGMPKTLAPYNSLNSIANNLSTAEVNIAQNDREYGNRFTVAFENIEGNRSSINQTADKLSTEIRERKNADTSLDTKITQTATDITNEVAATYVAQDGKFTSEAFGWSLKKDKWEVYKKINDKETPILVADKDGLEVTGKITAESGHIGKFIISDVHDCKIKDSEGKDTGKTFEASGIHSVDYITKFDDPTDKRGVYVGTDGIKVGSNFSVDASGVVTATELVLKPENVYLDEDEDEEETDPETGRPRRRNLKNRLDKGDDNTNNLISALEHRLGEGITNTELTNEIIIAPHLGVNGAYISGELLVGNDKDTPKLHINIDDPTVKIGGFEVSTSGISSNKDTAKYNTTFGDSADGDSGVYVGTDGIRLGKTFSVNPDGAVVATNLTITGNKTIETALSDTQSAAENTAKGYADTAEGNAKTAAQGYANTAESNAKTAAQSYANTAESNAKTAAQTKLEEVFGVTAGQTVLADTWLSTTDVYAKNLTVQKADITDKLEVKNGDNTIIYANTAEPNNVRLGNFVVDTNSISLPDDSGSKFGTTGTIMMCTGSEGAASIGGSESVDGWNFTAGTNFGVRTDRNGISEFYASKGKIGGFTIDSNSISYGTLGDSGLYLGNGTTTALSVAGSGSKTNWRLVAGNLFGVDDSGNIYANGGNIGNFNIRGGALTVSSGTWHDTNGNYKKTELAAGNLTIAGCESITTGFSTREHNNYYIEASSKGLSSSKLYRTFSTNKGWTEREYVSVPGFRQSDAAVEWDTSKKDWKVYPATIILYKTVVVNTKVTESNGWLSADTVYYRGTWKPSDEFSLVKKIITFQTTIVGAEAEPPTISTTSDGTTITITSAGECSVMVWAVCYAASSPK